MNQTSLVGRPLSKLVSSVVKQAEKRGIWIGPVQSSDAALHALLSDGPPASSGMFVSDQAALTVAAMYCGVSRISGDVAALPCVLLRGSERFTSHPVYRSVHDFANATTTSFVFWQTAVVDLLLSGNSYAEIARNPATGQPSALFNIHSGRVTMFYDRDGQLRYRIANHSAPDSILPPSALLHFKNMSFDGLAGLDLVAAARETLGLALAADRHAGTFFANGGTVTGVVSEPAGCTEQSRMNLQRALDARHKGTANAHRWLMLPNGVEFKPISATARESEFTDLRRHQVRDVARFLKMPPTMLGDMSESAYSSAEQEAITYVTGCLTPLVKMLEAECNLKLVAPSEQRQQRVKFVLEGLLRGDSEKRAQFYAVMASHGLMTANEIRSREDLPPVAGGDVPRIPLNTGPMTASATGRAAVRDLLVDTLDRLRSGDLNKISRMSSASQLKDHAELRIGDLTHRANAVFAIRPAVRAALAIIGKELETEQVCEALARTYCDSLKSELRAWADRTVTDAGFTDKLAAQISTWKTSARSAQLADDVFTEMAK